MQGRREGHTHTQGPKVGRLNGAKQEVGRLNGAKQEVGGAGWLPFRLGLNKPSVRKGLQQPDNSLGCESVKPAPSYLGFVQLADERAPKRGTGTGVRLSRRRLSSEPGGVATAYASDG